MTGCERVRKQQLKEKNNLQPLIFFTYYLLVMLLSSCVSLAGISNRQKQELTEKGYPVAILLCATGRPNSVGGVGVSIVFQNISEKEIKYVNFTVVPYNRVNDIVSSSIGNKSVARLQYTGPYKPGAVVGNGSYWDSVWYNSTIVKIEITKIEIIFMDGSVINIDTVDELIVSRNGFM